MRVDFRSRLIVLACISVAAGCSATGPEYRSHAARMREPEPNISRLIVYRPHYWVGQAASTRIQLDGETIGECDNKGFNTFDVYPGAYRLSADAWGSPGTCEMAVSLEPGREYFYEIKTRSEAVTAGFLGGVIGQVMESSGKECGGAYSIEPVDQETARRRLASLRLTDAESANKVFGKRTQRAGPVAEPSQFSAGEVKRTRDKAMLHQRDGSAVVLSGDTPVELVSARIDRGYTWWWVKAGEREGWILESEIQGQ